MSNRVVAMAEFNNKLAVGTRASEILEINIGGMGGKPKVVTKGHFDGELWGLAIHSKLQ